MPKFIITGLYHTEELNDSTLPPIEVEADSRFDALIRLRATVWTKEEYEAMPAPEGYPAPIKFRCE